MYANIHHVEPDLCTPRAADAEPAAGRRVIQIWPEFENTRIHHTVYLPTDWVAGSVYPVIVEFAGNGNYRGPLGDICTGTVEDCNMGFGISGGIGFIWICMPFVDPVKKENAIVWWGDPSATAAYCKSTVNRICEMYGGDPGAVVLTGFSRGSIACNFIGLCDDEIASIWRAFIAHSHYDGVLEHWPYPGADRASAASRLQRLGDRPVLVCNEGSVEDARRYLESTGLASSFTFMPLPFRNHTDCWLLRDIPERQQLRAWLHHALMRP